MVDKNQAIIDFLLKCPEIIKSQLFFNFINAKNTNKQIVTVANDKVVNRPYVDGSVLKRYTFTIIDYRSVSYIPIPKEEGYSNENVDDLLDVQSIIDWITEQDDSNNYPDFGEDCKIDSMRTTTDNPNLNGINTQLSPALAVYSVSIQIDYIDYSKAIWR